MNKQQWMQFFRTIKTKAKQIVRDENVYFRVFSLVLAIILWIFATGENQLLIERTISLTPSVINLPGDSALITTPAPVKVQVRGLGLTLDAAERGSRAVIDLSGALEGEGTYSVDVSVPTGIEIDSVSPRWIRLTTERIITREESVTIGLLGLQPEHRIQSLTPEPDTVMIRAPRSILDLVAQVVAYITLNQDATHVEGYFPVRAIDSAGREVERVEFEPNQVRAIVERISERITYQLPIVANFTGELAPNLEFSVLSIEPEHLVVYREQDTAPIVSQLYTEPIYLTELTSGEYIRDVAAMLPEGLQPSGTIQITVSFTLTELIEDNLPSPDLESMPEIEEEDEPELDPKPEVEDQLPEEPTVPLQPIPESGAHG